MKLMKKIVLIFVTITVISSISFFVLGRGIINELSTGERERGAGRTNGEYSKVFAEVNKIGAEAKELGGYIEIFYKQGLDYNDKKNYSILNWEMIVNKSKASNIFLLNSDYNLIEKIKEDSNDISKEELDKIISKLPSLVEKEENRKKRFAAEIVGTDLFPYNVGIKQIQMLNGNVEYLLAINTLDEKFINDFGKANERVLSIRKSNELNVNSLEQEEHYGKTFLYDGKDTVIDVYIKLNDTATGVEYYLCLTDDREVRNSATTNVNTLVFIIIILTVIANFSIYIIIKNNVLKRILYINNVVNEVSEGADLNIKLKEDQSKDEIAILSHDINKMFDRIKIYSDNLEYIGKHDLLTSLMNRHKLMECVGKLEKENREFILFFIDLDNFKGINDSLGHKVGDELLCNVAESLKNLSDEENLIVSRIGGDEFVVISEGDNSVSDVNMLAEKILSSIHRKYKSHNYFYEVKASMGITFFPKHSKSAANLLQYADIALYNSKGKGGNKYAIFDESMLKPLEIENNLKRAIDNGELEVYYQPIYGVNMAKMIGAEALIRWKTEKGMIPPDEFIYLAKKTGDIVDIDTFVLKESIKTCREWIEKGEKDFYISINASKLFLKQNNFVEFITNELEINKVPKSAIRLEITEDEVIDDVEYTIELLRKVREVGIEVALDDFGVGYSSFNHIKILPVDIVKIDRSLIMNIENDIKSKSIVKTMISLCRSLNLQVICEGVEDESQVNILKELDCDSIQGYYFSKPLQKSEFVKLYDKWN